MGIKYYNNIMKSTTTEEVPMRRISMGFEMNPELDVELQAANDFERDFEH
jgi:hypothetical protein